MEYLHSPARQLGYGVSRGYRHDQRLSLPSRNHLRLGSMMPKTIDSHREHSSRPECTPPPSEREYSVPVTPPYAAPITPPGSRTLSRRAFPASTPVPWALDQRPRSQPGFAGLPTSASDHFQTGHMRPMVGNRISSASASNEGGSPGGPRAVASSARVLEGGVYKNERWTPKEQGRARPGSATSGQLEIFAV
jgi:hypothetical protein